MKPLLPQDDPHRIAREEQLIEARKAYQFDYSYFGLGFIQHVPFNEEYKVANIVTLTKKSAEYFEARAMGVLHDAAFDLTAAGESAAHAAEAFVHALLGKSAPSASPTDASVAKDDSMGGVGTRVSRYLDMFASKSIQGRWAGVGIPFTDAWKHWDEDWYFAYQAVAGVVPDFISCIDAPVPNFPISDEVYQRVTGDSKSFATAIAERRIFLWNFEMFNGTPGSSKFGFDKVPAPLMVMFAWNDTNELGGFGLRPVMIQCGQTPDSPRFSPTDGYLWKMARLCAQAAIGGVSGCYTHFGVHMVMERCIIATHRTLSPQHPILHLLAFNYQLTLPTNVGLKHFTMSNSFVPDLLAPPANVTMEQFADAYVRNFRFDQCTPPALFRGKGLDDPKVMPIYPFREDTTKLWKAIDAFVCAYVGAYYADDAAVAKDWEVQAWVKTLQLQSEEGAKLNGIGVEGKVETVAALSALVGQIFYFASAYHAAVNFSGLENFSFPMVVSFAGVAPPTADTPNTEAEFVARTPPLHYAWKQFFLVWFQSMLWENTLGNYPEGYFEHPDVTTALATFQSQLRDISLEISASNAKRPLPYYWQRPEAITSSIQG